MRTGMSWFDSLNYYSLGHYSVIFIPTREVRDWLVRPINTELHTSPFTALRAAQESRERMLVVDLFDREALKDEVSQFLRVVPERLATVSRFLKIWVGKFRNALLAGDHQAVLLNAQTCHPVSLSYHASFMVNLIVNERSGGNHLIWEITKDIRGGVCREQGSIGKMKEPVSRWIQLRTPSELYDRAGGARDHSHQLFRRPWCR